MRGKVIKWEDCKGWGLIESERGHIAFVHYTYIVKVGFKSLTVGGSVEFKLYEGKESNDGKYEARDVIEMG